MHAVMTEVTGAATDYTGPRIQAADRRHGHGDHAAPGDRLANRLRVGQLAQAVVLLALLFAVTRRDVRAHFGGQAGMRATTA